MKEAIGGVSLFQIVIVFIIAFAGIMALTINHSRAFAVKDEIITIIETTENNGSELSDSSIEKITRKLQDLSYRNTGNCNKLDGDNWVGYDRNGNKNDTNAAFCVRTNNAQNAVLQDLISKCGIDQSRCKYNPNDYPDMHYYDIVVFYQLDIPILNDLMNFKLRGSTKIK